MKLTYLKLLLAGGLGVVLQSTGFASTFWDSTLTLQGQTLDLGAAGRTTDYAAFTTNGDLSSSTSVAGEIDIDGNVGGNGNMSLANSVVNGNATLLSSGRYSGNRSQITGSLTQGKSTDSLLSQGRTDANTFTSSVMKLSSTSNYTTSNYSFSQMGNKITVNNQMVSITATDNNPVVLKLSAMVMSNNSTLTLNGSSSEHYVIDISGNVSLAGGSKVLLGGGLQAGNVVFVMEGSSSVAMSGASLVNGIVLAANGSVALSGGSEIDGEAIAKTIAMSGGSKIKKPKKTSP